MALPAVTVADLRSRLDVGAEVSDDQLQSCLDVSAAMIDPRVDPLKVTAQPGAYIEGVQQLACKVWDTRSRGMATLGVEGEYVDFTAHATAGMYRAVLGVLQPVLIQGGVVVG